MRADIDGDAQIFDLSGRQREQGFCLWQGNLGRVLNRSPRGVRGQDQMASIACHLHVSAPVRVLGKVALPDAIAGPVPLDQPGQGRGQQKDTGGTHL